MSTHGNDWEEFNRYLSENSLNSRYGASYKYDFSLRTPPVFQYGKGNHMFKKQSDDGYIYPVNGVVQKTLAYGASTLMVEFKLQKGAKIPSHLHPHEQTGYLVKGRIQLTIGSETHDIRPGDSWCIHGNVPHSADSLEDSVAIEVFSPVREDYLP